MSFTVSDFKANLASHGGGARPNLFKVKIDNSVLGTLSLDSTETILVKTASIPGSTIASVPVNFIGRPIKYTGGRTYENWSTTIINDENFTIRDKIVQWMRVMTGTMEGERNKNFGSYATDSGVYFEGKATVTQINKDGSDGENYSINNLWPTSLAAIGLDWSQPDQIEEYAVEWCFDTWTHNV